MKRLFLTLLILLPNNLLQGAERIREIDENRNPPTFWFDLLPREIQDMVREMVLADLLSTSPETLHLLRTLMPPIPYDFQNFSNVNLMSMTSDGSHALTADSASSFALLWNLRGRVMIPQALSGHTSQVSALCISDDACIAVAGGTDASLILWDLEVKNPLFNPRQLLHRQVGMPAA